MHPTDHHSHEDFVQLVLILLPGILSVDPRTVVCYWNKSLINDFSSIP